MFFTTRLGIGSAARVWIELAAKNRRIGPWCFSGICESRRRSRSENVVGRGLPMRAKGFLRFQFHEIVFDR